MDLDQITSKIGIPNSRQHLLPNWQQAQQEFPATLYFLENRFVEAACRATYLPDPIIDSVLACARCFAEEPALQALAWYGVFCHYHCPDYPTRNADQWPLLHHALGEHSHMFYLLVLLAGYPQMHAVHRDHQLPIDVIRESMGQILHRMNEYRLEHGIWGLDAHGARWLSNYMRGEIYAFGRLVHQFGVFQNPVRVYRCNQTHKTGYSQVIALSEDGVRYRKDGQLFRSEDDDHNTWLAHLELNGKEVKGCPILPSGSVLPQPITLDTNQWHMVLGPTDPALFFHIPSGSPMQLHLCLESMRKALEFFPRYFPEKRIAAFYTKSWLLDGQLSEMLSPQSNIVRLQNHAYMFPHRIADRLILKTVFGSEQPKHDRCKTSLERAMTHHLSSGSPFRARGGGGFVLPEEVRSARGYHENLFPWSIIN